MQAILKSDTTKALVFFMADSTDHVTGKTGLNPTVVISKNGAAFVSPTGSVAEIGNGFYKVTPAETDIGTLGILALSATSAGADQAAMAWVVVGYNSDVSIPDAVWDEPMGYHVDSGSIGDVLNTISPLDADGVRAAVGMASADLDTQLAALPTAGENADAVWDETMSQHVDSGTTGDALDNAGAVTSPSAIADAVWDESLAAHQAVGSTGEGLTDAAATGASAASIADAVWDEDLFEHQASQSAGTVLNDIPTLIGTPADTDLATDIANVAASLSAYIPTASTDASKGIAYVNTVDLVGTVQDNLTIEFRLMGGPAYQGATLVTITTARMYTNSAGYAQIALVRNDKLTPGTTYYAVTCVALGLSNAVLTLEAATYDLKNLA